MICSSVNRFFIVQFPLKVNWTPDRHVADFWGQSIIYLRADRAGFRLAFTKDAECQPHLSEDRKIALLACISEFI